MQLLQWFSNRGGCILYKLACEKKLKLLEGHAVSLAALTMCGATRHSCCSMYIAVSCKANNALSDSPVKQFKACKVHLNVDFIY